MRLMAVAVLSLVAAGCYRYVPVRVTLLDATTQRPVVGERVRPDYARFMELFPPRMDSATTDERGEAIVGVAVNYKDGFGGMLELETRRVEGSPPMPWVMLPLDEYRRQYAAAKCEGRAVEPIPLVLRLVP